jgi:hypothetical protein
MAKATGHPNDRLISSKDVEGTEIYRPGRRNIGLPYERHGAAADGCSRVQR